MKVINKFVYLFLFIYIFGLVSTLLFFESITYFLIINLALLAIIILFIEPKVILIYLIFLNERFFYLVDYTGKTTIDLMLFLIILMYIFYGREILTHKFEFQFEILSIVFLVIVGMILSYIINGQPITLAYHASKFMMIYLLYFPLTIFIQRYGVGYAIKTIHIIGTFLAGAFLLQKFLYPRVIIFHVMYMERFDSVRFFTGMSIVIFASFISLSYFLTSKRRKIKYLYLVSFIIEVSHLLFVAQTRSLTIVLVIVYTVIILFYSQKKITRKIVSTSLILLIGVAIFGSFINDVIESIITELEYYRAGVGTLYVRKLELEFILSNIRESLLFGLGFYSGHFSKTPEIIGTAYNYYLSDIGIFGYIFYMGILGLLLTFKYIVKLFKKSFLAFKTCKTIGCILILFNLYICLISPFNYIFNIEFQIIYLVIFTCILEIVTHKKIEKI
jgi:hypothetical protein